MKLLESEVRDLELLRQLLKNPVADLGIAGDLVGVGADQEKALCAG